jgi:glycosyltransferase involved in cell wall biosynthesis
MPYSIEGFKSLLKFVPVKIHLFHYSISENAPYHPPILSNLNYYNEESFSENEIISFIQELNPKFIFVTGWSYKKYLNCCLFAKKKRIPVISGCDTQWRGDIRQILAIIFSKLLIHRYFDYLMVAGKYQYEYARLLGFKRNRIFSPLYASNISLFSNKFLEVLESKQRNYPKNLLFVGRFELVKGIQLLIDAFSSIEDKKGWKLTLIGNGSLKYSIEKQCDSNSFIKIKDFLQPEELVEEVGGAGAFCLPSIFEPWGVVLHEFAAAGLPIICSDICGAASEFVTDKYNGFLFTNKNVNQLKNKLELLFSLSEIELLEYSYRSNFLSKKIHPDMYASNFLRFFNYDD